MNLMNLRPLLFGLLLPAPLLAAAPAPVAVVYSLSGTGAAMLAPGAKEPKKLELFAWLLEGTALAAPVNGSVLVSFQSGARYELGPKSRATLRANDLVTTSGDVKALASVPPFPRIDPVASGQGAQPALLRDSFGDETFPLAARVLAETAMLEWPAVAGATRYRVTIDAEDGRNIYQTETTTNTLRIPSSLLEAGARYTWRVGATPKTGMVTRGDAVLQVLPADVASARSTFQASLRKEGGSDALALMAEVDRSLGLTVEANQEMREAIALLPKEKRFVSPLGQIQIHPR